MQPFALELAQLALLWTCAGRDPALDRDQKLLRQESAGRPTDRASDALSAFVGSAEARIESRKLTTTASASAIFVLGRRPNGTSLR